MIHNDTYYEVSTNWGWFRLDEGAYRDYLAGASTFGKLCQLMDSERGLRGVRNLGAKSEKEISTAFISACILLKPVLEWFGS